MSLEQYRKKRLFPRTPEPPGTEGDEGKGPLSFVVHKHLASHLHFDFRLELDGVLKSWAVPKGPSLDPGDRKLAMMVEDHPFDYRTFEGVIPKGSYGAGPVMIWDRGSYHAAGSLDRAASEEALRKGLEKGHLSFVLDGERLKGEFALVRLKGANEKSWLLFKKSDAFARPGKLAGADTSVASGRTMEEIATGGADPPPVDLADAPMAPMPAHLKPMLATLVEGPFDRPGWLFELKWDGYRALAEVSHGSVRLYSRNDKTLNTQFSPIVEALESITFEALFDGEVVVVDPAGRADFQLLQNYLRTGRGSLVYYLFDLLHLDGHDLRGLPLARRKSILRQVLPDLPHVRLSDHVETEGTALFRAASARGVEGIIAKDGSSPYRPGHRGGEWLKVKARLRQEAVIGGFTLPRGKRLGIGALLLGVYEEGALVYIGRAGGGLTDHDLTSLRARLEPLIAGASPFTRPPGAHTSATWVKPVLVCEVSFTEWTDQGLMRQPVFLGLRDDKAAGEVRRERAEARPAAAAAPAGTQGGSAPPKRRGSLAALNDGKVPLTNLDKVFWPEDGYTKGDVIAYYRDVAPFILPHLKDRPESLHRHPDGITRESFYQKHVDHTVPAWVETVTIPSESEKRETTYLLCQDEAALLYMANLGCIEINPWHSRIGQLESPDYLVLDLDPLDVPFGEVVKTAVTIREVLLEIGAWGFCKTSGATGLHVYVPLGAQYSHEEAMRFARLVSLLVHARLPASTSMERMPEKRRGKVYLDYLQNGLGQTLVAPYSLRPRSGAPVSTPLTWAEVNGELDPTRFTMETTLDRLLRMGDLWHDVRGRAIDMARCLDRIGPLPRGAAP